MLKRGCPYRSRDPARRGAERDRCPFLGRGAGLPAAGSLRLLVDVQSCFADLTTKGPE
jgi:hypothetical protein